MPISEPVADNALMSKTAIDCETVTSTDQTQVEVDVAEVASDSAPSLVTDQPNPDVPMSKPVADNVLVSKTAIDCEAVPTADQTQVEVDVAEVASDDDQTCALQMEATSETVPETNQTPVTPAQADNSTAEV